MAENILLKILKKVGYNYEELSPHAKATFANWEKKLLKEEITPEKLKAFLKGEIDRQVNELTSYKIELNSAQDIWLKVSIKNNKAMLSFLEAPDKAVENFKKHLKTIEGQLKKLK